MSLMSWEERFWTKVARTNKRACWEWRGWKDEKGYGRFDLAHRPHARKPHAHRIAYELLIGPIPEGLTLDHKCHNTSCVNPFHCEPVSVIENIRRGVEARRKGT